MTCRTPRPGRAAANAGTGCSIFIEEDAELGELALLTTHQYRLEVLQEMGGWDAGTLNVAVPARVVSALRSAKEAFFALCVQTGKEVLATLMEQERTSLCGAKGVPNPERRALRGGHTTSRTPLVCHGNRNRESFVLHF